jgi:hypothetical protein
VIIRWLANKLFPIWQVDEGMINIHKRLTKLENESHSPLFEKSQLEFKGMKNYEGTD